MRFASVLQQQGAGGGSALSYSFLQGAEDTTDATIYTFSAQNLGAAASDRSIIVLAVARGGGTTSGCDITIGGVAATTDVFLKSASSDSIAIAHAAVPTGTTGDIVVTWQQGQVRCAAAAWRVTGGTLTLDDTASAADFSTTPTDLVLSPTSDNGVIVAGITMAGATTVTWAGATERIDEQIGAEVSRWSVADAVSTAASDTVTITQASSFTNVAAAAAYRGA